MILCKTVVRRALGSIVLLGAGGSFFFLAWQSATDAEGFYRFGEQEFAIGVLGITVLGAAIGNFFSRPSAGAAIGFVLSAMAFATWWVRCAVVLMD